MTTIRDLLKDFGLDCKDLDAEAEMRQRGTLDDDLRDHDEVVEEILEEKLEDLMDMIRRLLG